MAFDPRWQQVTCKDCHRTYICTPEDDFYGDHDNAGDGICFACLLKSNGMDPDRTRVLVIDESGHEWDPRDLAVRENFEGRP